MRNLPQTNSESVMMNVLVSLLVGVLLELLFAPRPEPAVTLQPEEMGE
jgi:hypothetical protein